MSKPKEDAIDDRSREGRRACFGAHVGCQRQSLETKADRNGVGMETEMNGSAAADRFTPVPASV